MRTKEKKTKCEWIKKVLKRKFHIRIRERESKRKKKERKNELMK